MGGRPRRQGRRGSGPSYDVRCPSSTSGPPYESSRATYAGDGSASSLTTENCRSPREVPHGERQKVGITWETGREPARTREPASAGAGEGTDRATAAAPNPPETANGPRVCGTRPLSGRMMSGAPTGRVTAWYYQRALLISVAGGCAASEQPPHESVKNALPDHLLSRVRKAYVRPPGRDKRFSPGAMVGPCTPSPSRRRPSAGAGGGRW